MNERMNEPFMSHIDQTPPKMEEIVLELVVNYSAFTIARGFKSSHCISLYTKHTHTHTHTHRQTDPSSTPWSCAVVLSGRRERERERERERKREIESDTEATLQSEPITGLSRDWHGRSYVIRSGRLPAEIIRPLMCP